MSDFVVKPQQHRTKGAVPKRAIAGVLMLGLCGMVVAYVLSNNTQEVKTADANAVAAISSPESVRAQQSGSPRSVDEAADAQRAAAEAERRRDEVERANRALQAASSPQQGGAAVPRAVLAGATSTVAPPPGASSGQGEDGGQIRAAQEVSRRNERAMVVDYTAGDGDNARPSSSTAGAANVVGEVVRQVAQRSGGEEAINQAMALAERMMPQSAASAPAQMNSQEAWAQRVSDEATAKRPQAIYPTPAVARLLLNQGSLIPAVTTRALNTDAPGKVTARVFMDVYDSQTASKLLIPKGAVLTGTYNNTTSLGQNRVQVVFTRLRMPDNSTYELPGADGYDQSGQAGLEGTVDRHFLTTVGSALLIGWLADRATKPSAVPQSGAFGTGGLSATGQVFVDVARAELERYKSTPATHKLPPATRINVEVAADMVFPSVYKGPRFE